VLVSFGSPDHLKLRSSVTLFAGVAEDPEPFDAVLAASVDGDGCGRTREVVAMWRAFTAARIAPNLLSSIATKVVPPEGGVPARMQGAPSRVGERRSD
jgi:hypothetical protein